MFNFTSIALKNQIKELELDKRRIQQELDHERKVMQSDMAIVSSQAQERIEKDTRQFAQDKKLWKEQQDSEINNLKASLILKHEQEVEQLKLTHSKEVQGLELKAQEEIIAEKKKLNEDFYSKMTAEMTKLHSVGNHQTDFLKDVTLKMLDTQKVSRVDTNALPPASQTIVNKVD